MRVCSFLVFFLAGCSTVVFAQLPPIGEWREHLPYRQVQQVASTANGVICATPFALFTIQNPDNTIERFSKTTGLAEVSISYMHYDAATDNTVVGYENGNINVVTRDNISTIDALKQKEIIADKKIYFITTFNNNAYLCTGLGIVVADTRRNEIKDTWVIGVGGAYTAVYGIAFSGTTVWAATAEGLKRAPLSGSNLSDYRNWTLVSESNGLTKGTCSAVLNWQNTVVAQKGDSVFLLTGTNWLLLYTSDWAINNITITEGKLLACQQQAGKGRVIVIAASGTVERTIQLPVLQSPQQAILIKGNCWVADAVSGLWEIQTNNNVQSFLPNSPFSVAAGEMVVDENALWVASGAVNSSWNNTFTQNGIFNFKDEQWKNYNLTTLPSLSGIYDIVTIATDKKDKSVWFGSFGQGLLQLQEDNTIQVFKQNSPLEPSLSNPLQYNIAGLTVDEANNLWISNYGAGSILQVKKADGTWKKFTAPFSLNNNAVSQILIDDIDQKWIVAPNGNGLLCFNHGQTIDNPADDKWKLYKSGKENGNLPSNDVLCATKDINGFVWVGTNKGVGIVQCVQEVFSGAGCEAVQPVVQQDNFAGLLFSEEQVNAIAVDGANRKWVGTQNGVWLISEDAEKIIYRFTEANSSLLSNKVNRISINGSTGEVFFSTSKGICSFRSTATTTKAGEKNVLVFPNPVPPGYNGTIAVRGLADNSIVKVTELNGRLVYQTRSLGGQAIWNGKDYRGRTISSGVYLVLASDESRRDKVAAKIIFISK
jgi:ligand-binding sensor domain-containing protein